MRRLRSVAARPTKRPSVHRRFKRPVHNRVVRRTPICFASSLSLSPWQDRSRNSLFPRRLGLASAPSRRPPRWRRPRPSKRRNSSGADGDTAGTIRLGAARAGTSVALPGGADWAGAAPPAGMAGAIQALSIAPFTDRQSIDHPCTARLFTGRRLIVPVTTGRVMGRTDPVTASIARPPIAPAAAAGAAEPIRGSPASARSC
jgi:hypothetical protein